MGIGIKGIKGITMKQFTLSLVLALSFLSSTVQHAEGMTTVNSTTGGYTFTIAIDGALPQPGNDTELTLMVEEIRVTCCLPNTHNFGRSASEMRTRNFPYV